MLVKGFEEDAWSQVSALASRRDDEFGGGPKDDRIMFHVKHDPLACGYLTLDETVSRETDGRIPE
jgi:hypothetical protein